MDPSHQQSSHSLGGVALGRERGLWSQSISVHLLVVLGSCLSFERLRLNEGNDSFKVIKMIVQQKCWENEL